MWERNIGWLLLACPQPGTWAASQARALTGDRTSDLSLCRVTLSQLRHTGQGSSPNTFDPLYPQAACTRRSCDHSGQRVVSRSTRGHFRAAHN